MGMAFLVWAMLPQTKGAKYLYDSFLKDFLKKNESKIDKALSDAKKKASLIASEAGAANLSSSSVSDSADVANDVQTTQQFLRTRRRMSRYLLYFLLVMS